MAHTSMIGAKISPITREYLEAQVKAEGSSISEYVRRLVEREATRDLPRASMGHDGDGTKG